MAFVKNLFETFQAIRDAERLTQMAPEEIPTAAAAGWHIAMREAKDSLPGLREEYRKLLLENATGIFVSGPTVKVAEFRDEAVTKKNVFAVDAVKVYETLAERVEGSLGPSRTFSAQQLDLLSGAIRDVALEAGLTEDLYRPTLKSVDAVPCFEDLVRHVRQLVRDANQDRLLFALATRQIVSDAIVKECVSRSIGVLVLNATPDEQSSLAPLFGNTIDVHLDADTVIDADFIVRSLTGKSEFQSSIEDGTEGVATSSEEIETGPIPPSQPEVPAKKPVGRPRKNKELEK